MCGIVYADKTETNEKNRIRIINIVDIHRYFVGNPDLNIFNIILGY